MPIWLHILSKGTVGTAQPDFWSRVADISDAMSSRHDHQLCGSLGKTLGGSEAPLKTTLRKLRSTSQMCGAELANERM